MNAYREAWVQYADHIVCDRTRNDDIKTVVLTEPGTLAEKLGMEVVMEPNDPSDIKELYQDYRPEGSWSYQCQGHSCVAIPWRTRRRMGRLCGSFTYVLSRPLRRKYLQGR